MGLNGTQGQANGSTVIYMLRDNRGYARIFTNAAESVTQYDDYDAFGNQTTSNGNDPPPRITSPTAPSMCQVA